jgi:hypothetical protein
MSDLSGLARCPECGNHARIFVVRGRMICESCRDRPERILVRPPGPGEVSGRAWCQGRSLDVATQAVRLHETPVQNISVRAEAEGVRGSAVEVPARIDARTRRLLWVLAVVLILGQLAWLNPLP